MITKITRNGLNGAMFVTISPFLVIDDNTIKVSINLQKIDKLNCLHLLGYAYHHPMSVWPPPKSLIPPLFLPLFATLPSYVDLIHLVFLPLWKTPPFWKKFVSPPLEKVCF